MSHANSKLVDAMKRALSGGLVGSSSSSIHQLFLIYLSRSVVCQ
jgi:hypothetical protein